MGGEGIAESISRDSREVVFDAGAVIAFERGNDLVRALVDLASRLELRLILPASALAQVWRGGPRSALCARLVGNSTSDSLDEARAKEIGKRLGSRGAADIADAHVVCCALGQDAILVTSDLDDMEVLAGPDEHLTLVAV